MVKDGRHDPNNTAWSKSKTKLGFKLLQKMGWDEGKGLGKDEDGLTEHVKVQVKEDTRGVGTGMDVSSWKSNTTRFEDTLVRLQGKRKRADSASSGSSSSSDAAAGVYVPPSPQGPAPKLGNLVASKRLYNRKVVRAKAEFKQNDHERSVIVGKAGGANNRDSEGKAEKKRLKKEAKEEAKAQKKRDDNLTVMQKTATLSMSDYFASMVCYF